MGRTTDVPAPISLKWPHVHAFRMARHHLLRPVPRARLAQVAGDLCGVQAQLMTAAELALRARVRGLRRQDVQDALWRDRTLAKTWCMRGTVHLLPSKDLPLFLRALRPVESRTLSWLVRGGLSAQEVEACVRAIVGALAGGPCTRRELADRVGESIGAKARRWVAHSWGGVVRIACARGLVCFGPERLNEITFVRIEDWLPDLQEPTDPEAKAGLLERYLAAYGPATASDYLLWTNLPALDAREAWALAASHLVRLETESREGWMRRGDPGAAKRIRVDRPVVRLLPAFDALLLGHKDKGHLVDAAHYKRVYRKAGWISQTILVDGQVAGVWTHHLKGERLEITLDPFRPLSRPVREGIHSEAEDLSRFLEASRLEVRTA